MNRIRQFLLFFVHLPKHLVRGILHAPKNLKIFFRDWVWQITTFSLLLLVYVIQQFSMAISRWRFFPSPLKFLLNKIVHVLLLIVTVLQGNKERTINRINLIDMALRNMWFKKSRAIVTVGGMAVGIGAIVFLVSLGYGINKLVIDRVARLEEMQQADVVPQPGSQVKINDASIARIKELPDVAQALPMIAVVAKVNYQNSSTDLAVYGVTTEYLRQTAIQPIYGKIFESDSFATLPLDQSEQEGDVAGISTDLTDSVATPQTDTEQLRVQFSIHQDQWLKVRSAPSVDAPLLGFTKRDFGLQEGLISIGGPYRDPTGKSETVTRSDGEPAGEWIESTFLLYKAVDCQEKDCEQYEPILDEFGNSVKKYGYVARIHMNVTPKPVAPVLGITEDGQANSAVWLNGDVLAASDEALFVEDGEWVEIASEAGVLQADTTKKIELSDSALRQAVVNTSMLKVLGISNEEAVGKKFTAAYQVVGNLLDTDERLESTPTEYTILGVIPEESAPFFYVPFIDLRSLGVLNFSQAKIVSSDKNSLAKVRQQVESLGFSTSSVADTVEQIDRLFATIRTLLALLGMVALSVAALGMFNTLTVSLLERTREVGLMKAMGMKSQEVRELFLTESMIMGFFGGLLGILLGYIAGKLAGLGLSIFSLSQGQGFINISHIPFSFIVVVFLLSLIVGIFTGIYPALRATKISALDALRYE